MFIWFWGVDKGAPVFWFVLLPTIKQQDTYTFLIVFKERKDNPSARRRVAAEIR